MYIVYCILYRYDILLFFSIEPQCFVFRKLKFRNINFKNPMSTDKFSIDIRLQHKLSIRIYRDLDQPGLNVSLANHPTRK